MDNIKYIILDFGKVIAAPTTGHWFITPKFIDIIDMSKIDVIKFNEKTKLFNNILSRPVRTLEEEYLMFYNFYENILRILEYPDCSKKIIGQLASDITYKSTKYTKYLNVNEELENLSKDYTLLMLTDNWPCVTHILREYKIEKYFDKVYISSLYGCTKENKVFFDYPIKDYDIHPGEAIFVDDNEKLLDIAKEKGLETRLMIRNANREVESNHEIIYDLNCLVKKYHK